MCVHVAVHVCDMYNVYKTYGVLFEARFEPLAEWRSHFSWVSCDDHEVVVHILCLVCVELCARCQLILTAKWSPACEGKKKEEMYK